MNNPFEDLMYRAGLTAQGCWDSMDEYDKQAVHKFGELVAAHCAHICMEMAAKCAGLPGDGALARDCAHWILEDFGVHNE